MEVLSKQSAVEMLGSLKGAKIVGVTIATMPNRFKRDEGRIVKVTTSSVMVNAHYDKAKAKRLGVDVSAITITPQEWSERVSGPIMRHVKNGTLYLAGIFLSGNSEYLLDGKPVDKAEIADMLKPSSKTPVAYRMPKIDSIKRLKVSGVEYMIV